MKKLLSAILCFCLLLSSAVMFFGCGASNRPTSFLEGRTFICDDGTGAEPAQITFKNSKSGEIILGELMPGYSTKTDFKYILSENIIQLEFNFLGFAFTMELFAEDENTLIAREMSGTIFGLTQSEDVDGLVFIATDTYTGNNKNNKSIKPTVTGLANSYTIKEGEDLNITFTVTAGNGADLSVITLKNDAIKDPIYRKPNIFENSYTINYTISKDMLYVGTHTFVVYASADNFTEAENEVWIFEVNVEGEKTDNTKRITKDDPCTYENVFKAICQILEDKNDGYNEFAKFEWETDCKDKTGWYTNDFLLLCMATAWTESEWNHFESDGSVKIHGKTNDTGIMQLNTVTVIKDDWLVESITDDWYYNLEYGIGNCWEAYNEAKKVYQNETSCTRGAYSRYNGGINAGVTRWENNPILQDINFYKYYQIMCRWFYGHNGGAVGDIYEAYEVFCNLYENLNVSTKNCIIINGVDIGYNEGQYFTKNGKACNHNGPTCHNTGVCEDDLNGCNCKHEFIVNNQEIELDATQCVGYAKYCSYMVFNKFPNILYSNVTVEDVKDKLLSSKPGSYLHNRTDSVKHAIVLVSADENSITYTDANYTGSPCQIQLKTITWEDFYKIKFIKTGSYTIYGESIN